MSTSQGHADCREVVELVTGYLEGTLSDSERIHFEHHLRKCPSCTAYIEQIRVTIRRTGQMPREPVPPEVLDKFIEIYQNWMATRR